MWKYKVCEAKGFFRLCLKVFKKDALGILPWGVRVKGLKTVLARCKYVINHEQIHLYQQLEMLIVPFYLWYLIEWLIRIPINGKSAYRSIAFEREAYANERKWTYLPNRKHFAWFEYLKIEKRDGNN